MLTEAYLKDIVRPPPTGYVPSNVAHPFQSSFYTYFTKKFITKHWYLAAGATFTLTLYGTLDALRESGKKSAYDSAVAAGRPPCKCMPGERHARSRRPVIANRYRPAIRTPPCMQHMHHGLTMHSRLYSPCQGINNAGIVSLKCIQMHAPLIMLFHMQSRLVDIKWRGS